MFIGMQEGAKRDLVRDQRIAKVVELSPPEKLLEDLPLGRERAAAVVKGREEVVGVLHGKDPRLLVVVGPCSVHDPKAALEYARRLSDLAERLRVEEGLHELGLETAATQANFSWIDLGAAEEKAIVAGLADRQVAVRPGTPLGDPGHIRVSYGTAAEDGRFLAGLSELLD